MTALNLNVLRVTVDPENQDIDLFSHDKLINIQNGGGQIVQARCGHLMEEEGLAQWAQTILNRPLGHDRTVRCPLCREVLMDAPIRQIAIANLPREARRNIQVRQENRYPIAGVLFFGGTIILSLSLVATLLGRGRLANMNPNEPLNLTLDELGGVVTAVLFKTMGDLGVAAGALAVFAGGTYIAAQEAVNYAAEKTHQAARGLYNWFTGQ